MKVLIHVVVLCLAALAAGFSHAAPPTAYVAHCATCHGAARLGGMGPALLPENLSRLSRAKARATILQGRVATQMPAFEGKLSDDEVDALVAWIYSPVTPAPDWGEAEIRASRVEYFAPGSLPHKPIFHVDDMLNLFVLVEGGDHHVSILDGDRMERIFRFPSRYALHGGPKFTADGRYVFFASRDGWISKFDIWNLEVVAEVRAGINTRNLAVSSDGRVVAVANYLPGSLVLFDADLNLLKVLPAVSADGREVSRVSAVYDAAPRHSFIAAMRDMPELWEVSYDPKAPPLHEGYVHDYKMAEAIATPAYLNPRRTRLEAPLDDFFFDQSYANVMGASRQTGHGQVVNLDIRRKVATLDLPGMPHLGSGVTWTWQGRRVMATPNIREGMITVIDMSDWSVVRHIPTPGPGFFLRSHEASPYAWADAMMSPAHHDEMVVIDKASLKVVKILRPAPGKTVAHVEFTRDGRYALVSLMEMDGAVVVYDARTLQEVKRISASKPIGKYNVFNKISRSEGTSH